MASASGDATFSFSTEPEFCFDVNEKVQIDGRGKAIVQRKITTTTGDLYEVKLDGTDFTVTVRAERLTRLENETENETESKSSSNAKPSASVNKRFAPVESSDIPSFVEQQSNRNTLTKTFYDLKLLEAFMQQDTVNEERPIYEMPPNELCDLLCRFFLSVRKSDGSNYEPNTLRGFLSSFDRQLRRQNYDYSLSNSVEFAQVREVLKSKQRQLKRFGLGNQPNKAEPITDQEIEKLWESKQFGLSTPDSIINTLWFYSTVHFGLRGSNEHRDMCWGDITLGTDIQGQEYLEFSERQTKTRTGENPRDVRKVKPKMWSNNENIYKCPVAVYKQYSVLRPADFCRPEDPFYLATHTNPNNMKQTDQWFKRQPIGVNKLSSLMKRMVEKAGLPSDKRLSNHSARKHLVQKLSENNVPPTQIMQITGHKNVQSVNNYSNLNENQHKQISKILSGNQQTYPDMSAPYGQNPLSLNQFNAMSYQNNSSQSVNTAKTVQGGLNMFSGNIFGGTFNINLVNESTPSPHKKRRRIICDSDSE